VDIDPFAVNIARLRLWLSLSVEFEGDDPPPLPNLKFEIDEGDSLAIPPHELQSSLRDPEIAHYAEVKGRYIKAHGEKKKEFEAEIVALRSNLATWLHSDSEQEGFDWQVRFADVFLSGGFDIIVANPPYISAIECAKVYEEEYRDHLKSLYRSAKGAYDLFILFFEVGVLCLRPGGLLAFITPNKYLSAKYGSELRSLLLSETAISQIVDLSSVRVFKKASVYPVLTFLRKRPASQGVVRAILPVNRDADEFNIEEYHAAEFPSATLTSLPENIWGFLLSPSTTLLSKLMKGTVQLSTIAEVSATSTAAEADAYGEYLSNARTSASVKVINTGTIEPYFTLWGKHPMTHSRAKYLTPWLPLTRAGVSGRRREMYQSPKIVFAKMAKTCEASLDMDGEYASLNTNCLYGPTKGLTLEYICAFCNSKVFMFIYEQFFGALRMSGGYFQFQSPQLRVMPITVITPKEQEPFVKQVRSLLVNIEQGKTLEQCRQVAEIDVLFYRLYGLNESEIAEIEGA
jgi:adenine-specific DNA-methyltransferase